jgi:hypothetical protein
VDVGGEFLALAAPVVIGLLAALTTNVDVANAPDVSMKNVVSSRGGEGEYARHLPVTGEYIDTSEYLTGEDYFTGEQLSESDRMLTGVAILGIGISGKNARGAGELAGKGDETVTGYRYMTQNELQATQKTELLRGGRSGETFFTKDVYKSQQKAQERLALPRTPTHRVEFKMLNNPAILRNGTKIRPNFGMRGGGSEFMTNDRVRVQIINWQSLR